MEREKFFMEAAVSLAKLSAAEGEVPVGAVVVKGDKIVGMGRNRREKDKSAVAHAEIEAINDACKNLGGWRLWQCEMFVTLEPCPMCAGAIINSRLTKVTFGAFDYKAGSCGSVINLFELPYNHKPPCEGGFMEKECAALLTEFFASMRKRRKEEKANMKEER